MTSQQGFKQADEVDVDPEEGVVDVGAAFRAVDVPAPVDKRKHRKHERLSRDRLIQVKTKQFDAKPHSIVVDTRRLDAVEDYSRMLDMAVPTKRNKHNPPFKDRIKALSMLYGPMGMPSGVMQDIFNETSRTPYHMHDRHEPLGTFY